MAYKITDVTGVAEMKALELSKAGIKSVDDLATASPAAIAAIPGFGPVTASRVIQSAQSLLSGQSPAPKPAKKAAAKPSDTTKADKKAKASSSKKKDKKKSSKKADKKGGKKSAKKKSKSKKK